MGRGETLGATITSAWWGSTVAIAARACSATSSVVDVASSATAARKAESPPGGEPGNGATAVEPTLTR
jgi:class 3 adenylate cyclase